MRPYLLGMLCCVLAASATACGGSKGSGSPDSAMGNDAADGRAGDSASTTDARDAATDAGADARNDAGTDAPRDVGGTDATDAGGDVPAGGDAGDALTGGDASADAGVDAGPLLVTLQFSGQVATVAGTPLGLDSTVRTAPVTGTFAYDLRVGDAMPTDPLRGRYNHAGSSVFTFTVSGHTVTGSGLAQTQVESLNVQGTDAARIPDTFRFLDGPLGDGATRIMKLDGTPVPSLVLRIAITDNGGTALPTDHQPNPFPFTDGAGPLAITNFNVSHTFSLMDANGTLLMQLDSIVMQ